jgi:hypothetical protein
LRIARANAYDALRGLVAKQAASQVGSEPLAFRATDPEALLAQVAARQTRLLDDLETRLGPRKGAGAPETVRIQGEREFRDVAIRTAGRERGLVRCLAEPRLLAAMSPLWNKRAQDGVPTEIWSLGHQPERLPLEPKGLVSEDSIRQFFPTTVAVFTAPDAAIAGIGRAAELSGFWSSDALLAGAVRAAFELVVSHL